MVDIDGLNGPHMSYLAICLLLVLKKVSQGPNFPTSASLTKMKAFQKILSCLYKKQRNWYVQLKRYRVSCIRPKYFEVIKNYDTCKTLFTSSITHLPKGRQYLTLGHHTTNKCKMFSMNLESMGILQNKEGTIHMYSPSSRICKAS